MGYSRAVRVGDTIEVSATAASAPDGTIVHRGDVYGQTVEALRIIGEALKELGASFENVTRTRVFILDPSRWEEVARAHGEVFGEIRPTTGVIGASGFIDPEILVEIEATALLEDD
jgi:enamine deaminase RidA (YjgF/YER057c/UK114 family)